MLVKDEAVVVVIVVIVDVDTVTPTCLMAQWRVTEVSRAREVNRREI